MSCGFIDAHLHDIDIVLQEEDDIDEHHEPPLINFEKWDHLKEKALDALRYRDHIHMEYDEGGLQTVLANLKGELQAVSVNDEFSQSLQHDSAKQRQKEIMVHNPIAQAVGF
jgi:hypothetical protein